MLIGETEGIGSLGFRKRRRRHAYVAPVVYEAPPVAEMTPWGCRPISPPSPIMQAYFEQRGFTFKAIPTPTGSTHFVCPKGAAMPIAIPAMPMPPPPISIPEAVPQAEAAEVSGSIF